MADFGIGKALGSESAQLTETGLSMGTPAYMSPEQAAGEKDIGPRTDIYSLATVLYEMLAGETPFTGPTAQIIIARRFTEPHRPVQQVREAVPPAVAVAIDKGLARTAADRFATAAEFLRALSPTMTTPIAMPAAAVRPANRRRIPVAFTMLILGVVLGGGVLFAWRAKQGGGEGAVTRLAVLPFENLGDSADAYFADGMTDEVRGKLSNLGTLLVVPRQSSMPYRGSDQALREIGEELGVQYLLTATVRWEKSGGANRVRVTPELVDVSTGSTRWQQPFDASLTDVFQVQGDIATEVAQALNIALGDSIREELAEKPTRNLAAWDAYLRGEEVASSLNNNDKAALRKAITYYEQATALDSGFVLAWSRLSAAHALIYGMGATPEGAEAARHAAERAVALGPASSEAHRAMGQYFRFVTRDYDRARTAFNTVLQLTPRDADALVSAGIMDRIAGDWAAAGDKLKRAADLDRRSLRTYIHLTVVLLFTRQYGEAEQALNRGRDLFPTNLSLLQRQVMLRLAQGNLVGAQSVISSAPRNIDPATLLAYMANNWDLYWVLDEPQHQLLLRMRPADFDDNRAQWATVFAQVYRLKGDSLRARAFADTAQAEFAAQNRNTPSEGQYAARGLALAYLGRKTEAIEEGRRAMTMSPLGTDDVSPYYQLQMVRIHLALGQPEKAIDLLEPLLKTPFYLSPGWLRVDPNFAPLRGNPRFERLARG